MNNRLSLSRVVTLLNAPCGGWCRVSRNTLQEAFEYSWVEKQFLTSLVGTYSNQLYGFDVMRIIKCNTSVQPKYEARCAQIKASLSCTAFMLHSFQISYTYELASHL